MVKKTHKRMFKLHTSSMDCKTNNYKHMKKTIQKRYLLIILTAFLFASCEEVIDVDLNSVDATLVVEGVIEPGEPVWLQLSYTSDYFSEDETKYEKYATIYLTDDNGNRDTLSYDVDGMYRGSNITGVENTTYTLSIYENNKGYQGTSTLLPATTIENIWFEKSSNSLTGEDEDKYNIHVAISNDTQQDNYYLFKFYTNGELEDDKYSITNSSYYSDEESLVYKPSSITFEEEDEVKVVVYRIDEDTYNYYSQLNDILESGIGSSSTPYNPESNFGEDVLGYFAAWSYDTYETAVQ
jgi:hypothetical protein